jgi:phenylacetic acid degradation operon negative regulatory protein
LAPLSLIPGIGSTSGPGRLRLVHARSALFDLYGDHLRARGGSAPVAALVRLMGALDISAPAVRTAVSRMVRQGWLAPRSLPQGPGYALTPKGAHRMADAGARVYRSSDLPWDGRWHLLITGTASDRAGRQRLQGQLSFLGYARVAEHTWMAPRPHPDAVGVLSGEGLVAQQFTAEHVGPGGGQGSMTDLITRAWDLERLGLAYDRFLGAAEVLLAHAPADDQEAFAQRSELVHEWRKFLFRDPGLPRSLLPEGWPGIEAADYFAAESARLLPAASRHIDACLRP